MCSLLDWARLRCEGVGWVRGRGVKVWVWLVVRMWMMRVESLPAGGGGHGETQECLELGEG